MSKDICSPLDKAMHEVVHDHPGGAPALADKVSISPGTLSNKVNWEISSHKLSVKEAVAIQHATKDYRILHAEAVALNHAVVYIGSFENSSDVELLTVYAEFHKQVGETSAEIQRALEDNRITTKELNRIRSAGRLAVQAYLSLEQRLEAISDAS